MIEALKEEEIVNKVGGRFKLAGVGLEVAVMGGRRRGRGWERRRMGALASRLRHVVMNAEGIQIGRGGYSGQEYQAVHRSRQQPTDPHATHTHNAWIPNMPSSSLSNRTARDCRVVSGAIVPKGSGRAGVPGAAGLGAGSAARAPRG